MSSLEVGPEDNSATQVSHDDYSHDDYDDNDDEMMIMIIIMMMMMMMISVISNGKNYQAQVLNPQSKFIKTIYNLN